MTGVVVLRGDRVLRDLRMVGRQVYYEQLNFWLNPVGAVFTVGFSVVFLLLVASGSGNSTAKELGGVRLIQYYVPGFLAYGVMAACFNALAISLVVRREMGLLKRLRLSPLPAWMLIAAVCISAIVVSAIQVGLVLVVGKLAYHVTLPHNWLALLVALVVGVASFTGLGIAVSTLVPNQEAGGPVVSIVFFVLLFLSGLWFPLKPGSGLATFSSYFPIRHLITAVYAPFDPRPGVSGWSWSDLLVLAVWGAVAVAVAARRWSWAPRQSGRATHTVAGSALFGRRYS